MRHPSTSIGALAVVLLAAAAAAWAQEKPVAVIAGREVARAELRAFLANVNPLIDYEKLPPSEQRRWVNEYVTRKLFALEARAAGLDQRPDVRAQVEFFTEGVLAQAYREQAAKQIAVTPAEVAAYYQQHKDAFRTAPRVRAEHLILRTRAAADAVLQQWQAAPSDQGKRAAPRQHPDVVLFEEGWYSAQTLPPALLEPLLAATGEWVGPLETGYGWHIFRIQQREPARLRAQEEVAGEITDRLRQQKAQAVYAELLEKAKRAHGVQNPAQ